MTEEVKEEIKEEQKVEQEKDPVKEPTTEDQRSKKEKKDKYKEQIAKLEAELKEQKNEYLKVFAEMENTKRRLKEEAIKDRKYASQKVIGELINPIDMLVKIVNSEAPSPEIEAQGKEFDPSLMQAMSTEENADLPDNAVLKVMQTGYMYKDRVLRPAMVIVNKINQEKKEEE